MKLKSILCAAGVLLATAANAQNPWLNDSVAMGAGYANDIFYNISNKATKIISGSDWDLGFQMTVFGEPSFNASIRANHAKKSLEVYSLHMGSASFASITAADTVGKTGLLLQLTNNDTSWGTGAFYQNRLVTDAFSFGWGEYTGPSGNHSVVGDSVYLLRVAGVPYKFWVQKYTSYPTDSINFVFRIAKLDGTNDRTVQIYRKAGGFTDRLFAYYDITSNTVIDREPSRSNWDMLFTQYFKIIPAGPGVWMPQVFTGVLGNQSMEVADIRHITPDMANYSSAAYTTHVDEIGADWKAFNNTTFQYSLDDSASYFIKAKTSKDIYQLKFTRFDGGSPAGGGKIVFAKRYITTLGVSNLAASTLNSWAVAPNPASNEASIMIDAKKAASAYLIVTDMAGRNVQNTSVALKQGINGFSLSTAAWSTGMYAVQVVGEGWHLSTRLAVAH